MHVAMWRRSKPHAATLMAIPGLHGCISDCVAPADDKFPCAVVCVQELVLQESAMMIPETRQRLETAFNDLQAYLVSAAAWGRGQDGLVIFLDVLCAVPHRLGFRGGVQEGVFLRSCPCDLGRSAARDLTPNTAALLTRVRLPLQAENEEDVKDTEELTAAKELIATVQESI